MRLPTFVLAIVALGAISSGRVVAVQEPSAAELMQRVGAYAAAYGEKSSVVVAVETYTQRVTVAVLGPQPPVKLIAEFAIVKVEGGAWTGFRDVLEVNGEPVQDRRDRLASLLAGPSPSISEATRIADESARFNVGPIARNINTPTATLFFFLPQNLERFAFTRKGARTIDGTRTIEIAFKETRLPTLITTRAGRNVPLEGSLWITDEGAVIRTRMRVDKFADRAASYGQTQTPTDTAQVPRPTNVTSNNGGREAVVSAAGMPMPRSAPIASSADIEVTYRKPPGIDLWLPAEMVELYEGPMAVQSQAVSGRATTRASYGNFKQFGAAGRIVPQ
jgi:hypothetical protein